MGSSPVFEPMECCACSMCGVAGLLVDPETGVFPPILLNSIAGSVCDNASLRGESADGFVGRNEGCGVDDALAGVVWDLRRGSMRLATPVVFGVLLAEDFDDEAGGNAENKSVKSLTGEIESPFAGVCVRKMGPGHN